jgi:hypothetical protein
MKKEGGETISVFPPILISFLQVLRLLLLLLFSLSYRLCVL